MERQERKLREFIRRKVHNLLNEEENSSERAVRKEVRSVIQELLTESNKNRKTLNEGVMGMADMPAVNPANSFSKQGKENFSYDPNAVSQMAKRDRQSAGSSRQSNTLRSDSDLTQDQDYQTGPNKTGYDSSQGESEKVIFENQESGDRASLWVEGNQLVCEYESKSKGSQKTKLSEERTREILEKILNDNFQM